MTSTTVGASPLDLQSTLTLMLATPADRDIESLDGTHIFDQKMDGIRATAAWQDTVFRLTSRSGRDITDPFLEIQRGALSIQGPLLLDGEIVAESGSFQEANWRMRVKGGPYIAQKHPVWYAAFDVLIHPEHGDVRHLPYKERRKLLNELGLPVGHGPIGTTIASTSPSFYHLVKQMGGEGVVAKSMKASYSPGRSANWLKYKTTKTVSCLVVGFEEGKGSRAHMGAAIIAMTDPVDHGRLRVVGKVGSGFTADTSRALVSAVNEAAEEIAHRQNGDNATQFLPVIEVECLGLTSAGKLRQPVFKGFREDLDPTGVTTEQLSDLNPS